MSVVIVTGSSGLVGSESVRFFALHGFDVVGIDNDMRAYFFGKEASTEWLGNRLEIELPNFRKVDLDIRNRDAVAKLFEKYGRNIVAVVHTAAQPSHDWAAKEPFTDFDVNAGGTLAVLEATRAHCPEAVFIFTSTNKVYGDTPNRLPLTEAERRWEVMPEHPYALNGIDEAMSIDCCLHSVFGASKVAADIMVQEYGRYFGLKTGVFRGGCLTGPNHSGTQLHGFLAYLVKCAFTEDHYTIFGYKGKQVRDNIHSVDLINAFWEFFKEPRAGEVYNIGGGVFANCSVIEAISICEQVTGRSMKWSLNDCNRVGDHIWWVSDTRKFSGHYPEWKQIYDIKRTIQSIYEALAGNK